MKKVLAAHQTYSLSFGVTPVNHILASNAESGFDNKIWYSDAVIRDTFEVMINGENYLPIVNNDGILLFSDIPVASDYTLSLKSDKFVTFCNRQSQPPYDQIQISDNDKDPLLPNCNYVLKPSYNYFFPEGMTVLKGIVHDQQGQPVVSALIHEKRSYGHNTNNYTITDRNGAFALYFLNFGDQKKTVSYDIDTQTTNNANIELEPGQQIDVGIITV